MALLHVEGFDDGLYNVRAVCLATPNSSYGRHGNGVYLGDDPAVSYQANITMSGSTLVYGCGLKLINTGAAPNQVVTGTGMPLMDILGGSDLTGVRVTVNGNTVATSTGDVPTGWNFIEVKVVYSATVGSIEIRVNGAAKGTGTSLDTGTAPTDITAIFGGTTAINLDQLHADDLYILDGTGSFNNDFLGDIEVVSLLPSGNGTTNTMTNSDSNQTDNYSFVDENPLDTADYVGSATEGHKDTYAMGDLTGTPTVYGVVASVYSVKSDTGVKYMRPILRSGTTDYAGTSEALSTDYGVVEEMHDVDPDTATTWLYGGVNSMEIGQEVRNS